MTQERIIIIEGNAFQVTISDDHKALQSAYAEGRAVIGLWNRKLPDQSLAPAQYVVENLDDVDERLLERAVRRRKKLPWQIEVTDRLIIREFTKEDWRAIPGEPLRLSEEKAFCNPEALEAYIRFQYGFYEYGIWALEEKSLGRLVGMAGITNLEDREFESLIKENDSPVELGYHIFSPYRRLGYGKEGSKAILDYCAREIAERVYARIDKDNQPSIRLAESLGFELMASACNGSASRLCLYEWNFSSHTESASP